MLRSAKTVAVGSERLSKTLIRPLFSATKTRPSGEKRTAVGFVNPEIGVDSWKLAGSVMACAWLDPNVASAIPIPAAQARTRHPRVVRSPVAPVIAAPVGLFHDPRNPSAGMKTVAAVSGESARGPLKLPPPG